MAPFASYYNSELTLRLAVAAATLVLFFIANRHAFGGYFSADDLDTLTWAPTIGWDTILEVFVAPRPIEGNVRAVGVFFYRTLYHLFHFEFRWWLAVLWSLHVTVCLLLYALVRRLRVAPWPAYLATLCFLMHPALFDAWWKPMFWFDVLCALFCLATLLLWSAGRPLAAAVTFWLAIKSKEPAIFLPLAMAAIRVSPWLLLFFGVSAMFGIQGMLFSARQKTPYRMNFSLEALKRTVPVYLPWIVPLAAAPAIRLWAPLALVVCLTPLLFLPNRLFSVYLYLPLTGVAVVVGHLLQRIPVRWATALVALWLTFSYWQLRQYRRAELAITAENRSYVQQVMAQPPFQSTKFLHDGRPPHFEPWGIEAALRHTGFPRDLQSPALDIAPGWQSPGIAVVTWDRTRRKLSISPYGTRVASSVDMADAASIWQLDSGFLSVDDGHRPMREAAFFRLKATDRAARFRVAWRVLPGTPPGKIDVLLNDRWLGNFPFEKAQDYATSWPLPWPVRGVVKVEIQSPPNEAVALQSAGFED